MLDRTIPGGGKVNFPDWLPDEFWQEMVAEVRSADGWDKVSPRNEAWDLLVYAIALSLFRIIKIEHLDWEEPPGWAAEWDENDLVFHPEAKSNPHKTEPQKRMSLEELAAALT
jgi:phage terminase large subunit GpA-like protein